MYDKRAIRLLPCIQEKEFRINQASRQFSQLKYYLVVFLVQIKLCT